MPDDYEEIVRDLLADTGDNYFGLWEIHANICRRFSIDEWQSDAENIKKLLQLTFELVPKLLAAGFAATTYSAKDWLYTAWPDQSPDAVIAKIQQEWNAVKGLKPERGFIVWFRRPGVDPAKRVPPAGTFN